MKLTLIGHDDLYAVEQLQLALFPADAEGEAVSRLSRGKTWLTASTKITRNGETFSASRRLKASEETVRLRRRALQQSYYLAALPFLPEPPPWGALAGVRPTKITTRHLLEGGTPESAGRLLRDVYYVTQQRRQPLHRQTDRAAGTLSGGPGGGNPAHRQTSGKFRPEGAYHLYRRRHPHHPVRLPDGQAPGSAPGRL